MFFNEIVNSTNFKSLSIKPNDTVLVTVDPEYWSADTAQELFDTVTKALPPTCAVIITIKGVDINIKKTTEGQ